MNLEIERVERSVKLREDNFLNLKAETKYAVKTEDERI
jgi:hypothetical protein